ncbi:hypothetical protein N6H14_12460 [Paenibacillus sp. CC-CFT747]|nr:hypothetical protein N6H14_12460 [Paenibacillus sp. CC-CFT747]
MANRSLSAVLAFMCIHFSLSVFVYPEFILRSTQQAHWEVVLFGSLVELFFMWILLKGLRVFPNQDMIDILSNRGPDGLGWFSFRSACIC